VRLLDGRRPEEQSETSPWLNSSDSSDTEPEKLRPEEESLGWFAQEDINSVADQLPNNSTAAFSV
jgi:hypothetical protein